MNDTFIENRNEMTRCALRNGSLARFCELYESSDRLRQANPWLYEGAAGGHFEIVKFLLSQGHSPNERSKYSGKPPALEAACRVGASEVAAMLINAGADLNVDSIDDNALFSAVHARSLDCVRLLVDAGIDMHKTYDLGHRFKNALAFAEEEGCADIATYLRERGAVLPPAK